MMRLFLSKKRSYLIGTVLFFCIFIFLAGWQNWQLESKQPILGVTDQPQIINQAEIINKPLNDNQAGFEVAVVKKVIDGDTIELADGRKVRYIGIDTPELAHFGNELDCYAQEAFHRNQELVAGKTVFLEKDVSDVDRYGRLLRYVWVDDLLINQQLVSEGYALARSYPPDISKQELLATAEQNARENQLGLWAKCPVNGQKAKSTVDPSQAASLSQAAGQSDNNCSIKGNISANGHLYHLPNCPAYDQVQIDENKGEKWFCTEEEAKKAGWEKANNCP